MDVSRLDQAFRYTETTSQHGGLLVARHGWLVYERYFGRAARDVTPNMYSVGKTFTSLCCGIMLDEHRSRFPDGLDQKVFTETYLPEAMPLYDPRKAEIRLGHLLTMTSGLREGASAVVRGKVVTLDALEKDGRGLPLHVAGRACGVDGAAPGGGDGDAGLHCGEVREADGVWRLGLRDGWSRGGAESCRIRRAGQVWLCGRRTRCGSLICC